MGTDAEKIANLLQQTKGGLITWEAISWDEGGEPNGWRTTTLDGGSFSIGPDLIPEAHIEDPVGDPILAEGNNPATELIEWLKSMSDRQSREEST